MKNYWKIDMMRKLIKLNRGLNIRIEMSYESFLRNQLKLMQEAQEFGRKGK